MPHILFVCSGNTCRSALAEGIARTRVGEDATFAGAGLEATPGAPASGEAVVVAAEAGVDLAAHRSRPLDPWAVGRSDLIYVMTRDQAMALLTRFPEARERLALLDPQGRDIADPLGLGLDAYRRARDDIAAAIEARLGGWRVRTPAG